MCGHRPGPGFWQRQLQIFRRQQGDCIATDETRLLSALETKVFGELNDKRLIKEKFRSALSGFTVIAVVASVGSVEGKKAEVPDTHTWNPRRFWVVCGDTSAPVCRTTP